MDPTISLMFGKIDILKEGTKPTIGSGKVLEIADLFTDLKTGYFDFTGL
jgi:hypothetical protein